MRLYISGNSGNMKIENEQQKIVRVLQMRKIECEMIDIMLPGNQNHRTFMRERGKKKEGQRNVIPPQIFNGEDYRGDHDDFDMANEDDDLEEFLGLERSRPKIDPYKTGAVAPDVGKLKVGKLPKTTSEDKEEKEESKEEDETVVTITEPEVVEAEAEEQCSTPGPSSDSGIEPDSGIELDSGTDDSTDNDENGDEAKEVNKDEENNSNFENEGDGITNTEDENAKDKTVIEDEGLDVYRECDSETDSDDFTDSEDDTVEFMPDGEMVRKCKRGFKQLQNCKRFWKATNAL